MREKYGYGEDLVPRVNTRKMSSNAWLGLRRMWNKVEEGCAVDENTHEVRWRFTNDSSFSVCSAYDKLLNDRVKDDIIWQQIWKMDIVQRCKMF